MASIAVHKESPTTKPVRREREWDPFSTMRDVLRWDPFTETAPRWFGEELGFSAAFEVKETKEAFIFKADLPGIKAEDLDVVLTQNRLTIRGKREAESLQPLFDLRHDMPPLPGERPSPRASIVSNARQPR